MAVEASLPTIGAILISAAVDSINPCAIGVLILLVSNMVATKGKNLMLRMGFIYIAAVYVTYFLAGVGLTLFFHAIPISIAEYVSVIVGFIVVIFGLIELKDFFWYGEGVSLAIPSGYAKRLHKYATKMTYPSLIFMGVFAAGVELPCTGGPYLAITLLLSQNFNFTAFLLLILYNIIFVAPLLIILFMVYMGTKIQHIKMWKHNNRGYMRLFTGVVMILLGWLLMLIANGTINLA